MKYRHPALASKFQAKIDEKFALHIALRDNGINMNNLIATYNAAATDLPVRYLGKEHCRKKLGSPEMSLTSVIKRMIHRRND